MKLPGIITITTDFGTRDEYVGVMKGVILERFPGAKLVDLTHEIDPGDIQRAAFMLRRAAPHFPAGTVHLVVVDPGVGSRRRAAAARTASRFFVAPDNGVLSAVLDESGTWTMVSLDNPDLRLHPVSATFHGRDIFAPAAAHLAGGGSFWDLGARVFEPVLFPVPRPRVRPDKAIDGEILYADRFGNLITNIPRQLVIKQCGRDNGDGFTIVLGSLELDRILTSYAETESGAPMAIFGSGETLEISVSGGSAAAQLETGAGTRVTAKG